jgi:hypothetical protein
MTATAIVLSAKPIEREFEGWSVYNHVRQFSTLEELHAERCAAILQVSTEFCAFVDDDDDLPANTGEQIARITRTMTGSLAYTDWLQFMPNGSQVLRQPGPYIRARHLSRPHWMHQLVVMRTADAQARVRQLPAGLYWTEFLLYAKLAARDPLYVPEVGYHWNVGTTGFHVHPSIQKAQRDSVLWHMTHP